MDSGVLEEPGSAAPSVKPGDDVKHAKWGEGVVLDVMGEGDKAEVRIRFPDVGEKNLLLSWAPIEKI